MPPARTILILSLTRRLATTAAHPPPGLLRKQLGPLYLRLLVRGLRLLNYRLATVSAALAAGHGRFACLTFDVADEQLLSDVLPALDTLRTPATLFVPTSPQGRQISWGALRALLLKGWEVGSLGHELRDLTERSFIEQKRSIQQAKTLLTEHLGTIPKLFAYPFGAYDASTVRCVRDAGFTAAVTLNSGTNAARPEGEGPFHLRRLPLRGRFFRDLLTMGKALYQPLRAVPEALPDSAQPGRERWPKAGVGL